MEIKNWLFLIVIFLCSCEEGEMPLTNESEPERNFRMGFSSWTFGPTLEDQAATYAFIQSNGDILSEQVDDRIPWLAWIKDDPLPGDFVADIERRARLIDPSLQLVLSVSPLNTDRDNLIEDWSGEQISYDMLSDEVIADAYYKHLVYLVEKFDPDYLIAAMEVNNIWFSSPVRWVEFKLLMENVRGRLRERFPLLKISESVALHNFYRAQVEDPTLFQQEVTDYADQMDFVAVSFYPFFQGMQSVREYQDALDFLHRRISKPVAFVETSHLSEELMISALNINIPGDTTAQREYLEVLLANAELHQYEFTIWWTHRDYDALWETFPADTKAVGKIWRDTGLLDENGNERPAFRVWEEYYGR